MSDLRQEIIVARWEQSRQIVNAINQLEAACEEISEGGGCEKCPLYDNCCICEDAMQKLDVAQVKSLLDFAGDVYYVLNPDMRGVNEDYDNYRDTERGD